MTQSILFEQEKEEIEMEKPSINDSKTLFTKATSVNYKYNEEERKLLNSFDSMDYLPPHSKVSSQKR